MCGSCGCDMVGDNTPLEVLELENKLAALRAEKDLWVQHTVDALRERDAAHAELSAYREAEAWLKEKFAIICCADGKVDISTGGRKAFSAPTLIEAWRKAVKG